MDMNLSFSVLTADIISILLIGTLYLANRQKAEYLTAWPYNILSLYRDIL